MNTTPRTRPTLTTLALALATALMVLLGTAGPAAAAPSSTAGEAAADDVGATITCDDSPTSPWCWHLDAGPASNDSGGRWALAQAWRADSSDRPYSAKFLPRGEVLVVVGGERWDGIYAKVELEVLNSHGFLLDRDTFWVEDYAELNLGTPDGSGDVAEGNKVRFRVCAGGITASCTPWARGTA